MSYTFKNSATGNFTIVTNDLLECKSLSWKAKGLYIYMLSRPTNWKFNQRDLINRSVDGGSSVQSATGELQRLGLLKISKIVKLGKFRGYLWELLPYLENPCTEKPCTENRPNNNTNKNNTKKKEREKVSKYDFINFLRAKRTDEQEHLIKYPTSKYGDLAFNVKGFIVDYRSGTKLSKTLALQAYEALFESKELILNHLIEVCNLSKVEYMEVNRLLGNSYD